MTFDRGLAIGSLSLGVPAYIYIFSNKKSYAIISFICTLVGLLILNLIVLILKKNEYYIKNRIHYRLTRSGKFYNYTDFETILHKIKDTNGVVSYNYQKKITVKSNRDDLQYIKTSYQWTGTSNNAKVSPIDQAQKVIKETAASGAKETVQLHFERHLDKHNECDTGLKITNLQDQYETVKPVLAHVVKEKTKRCSLTVKLPEEPQKCEYIIMNHRDDVVKTEALKFNVKTMTVSVIERYPRIGYTYMIRWS